MGMRVDALESSHPWLHVGVPRKKRNFKVAFLWMVKPWLCTDRWAPFAAITREGVVAEMHPPKNIWYYKHTIFTLSAR
jgi:hypothetical protein